MRKLIVFWLFLSLFIRATAEPQRLSLDICGDYYLSLFSSKTENIILTQQAKDGYSLPMMIKKNIRSHRGHKEEIYRLKPDHVVYTDLSFDSLADHLPSMGIKVQRWPWAVHIKDLKNLYEQLGRELQNQQKVIELTSWLNKMPPQSKREGKIALMGAGGFIIGSHTHYDLFFQYVGMENYYQKRGFGQVSLESLVINPPDYIVTFGRNPKGYSLGEAYFDHALFKKLDIPIIDVSQYFLVCPSHEMIKAAEDVREQLL